MSRPPFAVMLVAAALVLLHAVATPALWPVDETANLAYSHHLLHARSLPSIDDPIDPVGVDVDLPGLPQRLAWERRHDRDGRQDIWVANHPPLPAALSGIGLQIGRVVGLGSPAVAMLAARLVSGALFVLAVWLTHALALLLRPGRPREATVAAAAMALTPTATHVSGLVLTDAAGMAAVTACLLVGSRQALHGTSRTWLRATALAAGTAALTRASALPAVAIMLALVVYGGWRHDGWFRAGALGGRLSVPLRALSPVALALVPAGLFWLRNTVLLGSITGTGALLTKFERTPNTPILELVLGRDFWLRAWNRMWADLATGHWATWPRRGLSELLLWILMLGLAWQAVVLVRRIRDGWRPAPGAADLDRVVVWGGLLVVVAVQVTSVVSFHSIGGSLHGRYLLGAHAVTVIVLAWAAASLPRIGRQATTAVVVLPTLMSASLLVTMLGAADTAWTREGLPIRLPELLGTATDPVLWLLGAVAAGAASSTIRTVMDTPLGATPATGRPAHVEVPAPPAVRPSSVDVTAAVGTAATEAATGHAGAGDAPAGGASAGGASGESDPEARRRRRQRLRATV